VATHSSPALATAVRRHAARHRVDVWHCEWTPYAQVLRDAFGSRLKSTQWSVMAHNVESLIWQRYVETEANAMKRWYIRQQLAKFEKFEEWAYSSATAAVAVSDDDAELMRERFGVTEVSVVENGVDTEYFRPQRDVDRDPARILFLGSLDWRPNQDAVNLLLNDIFPQVRRQVPNATLALVGRHPPDWMRLRAADMPGVELYADVPDVRPFLAGCGMLAVPLRIGGGSRLKILEALATGTPVVSTRIGAEGLMLKPGRDLMMAEGIDGMAGAIIRGILHPYELEDSAEAGRRVVLANYDWTPLAEKLDEVWWTVATTAATTAA
jgi:glycosyltransferase involved in cell wall biosynthesis